MGHPPQIPLTPQTNENNFSKWDADAPVGHSGYKYPRMLTRRFTEADAEAWLKKNRKVDFATRQEYYDERVPTVGSIVPILVNAKLVALSLAKTVGEPVIVKDAEDEKKVCEALDIPVPADKAEIAEVSLVPSAKEAELIAELARLKAEMAREAKTPKAMPRKSRGRPWSAKRRAAQERRLSPEEFAESE